MKQAFSFLFVLLFFISCKKEVAPEEQALAEQTLADVAYGTDPAQRMDVYLPAGRTTTNTKVFVMIHGGAWTTGDKTEFNEYIPIFKQRLPGYAIFNINYRLAALPSSNIFPTQENDVKAAFNFIVGKGNEYKFNPEKLAVLGASAGGHLGLLQAYKNATPKIKALVDMFGPTDMTALFNSSNVFLQQNLQLLLSGTPTSNAGMYQASSPINYVSSQNPPTLILHGGIDPLVPISQSTSLKTKLEAMGVTVQMVTYPTEGHGWTGASLTDTYDKITAFLTTYNP